MTFVHVLAISLSSVLFAAAVPAVAVAGNVTIKNCRASPVWFKSYDSNDGFQLIPASQGCVQPGETIALKCATDTCTIAANWQKCETWQSQVLGTGTYSGAKIWAGTCNWSGQITGCLVSGSTCPGAAEAAPAAAGAAPAGWTQTAYQASDIAVGRNGAVWFINGGTIYQVTASGPQAVPGAARNIAVDPNGLPWVVNSSGNIFRWNGSGWTQVPGLANDIGIGANGSVWIIGTDGVPASWNGSAWVKLSGGGTKISVDPSGHPWVINAANQIWRWSGSSWQLLPGAATDISVGPDGSVYVVGGGGQIYRQGTADWITETGVTGSAVAAGLGSRAWVARVGQTVITR